MTDAKALRFIPPAALGLYHPLRERGRMQWAKDDVRELRLGVSSDAGVQFSNACREQLVQQISDTGNHG